MTHVRGVLFDVREKEGGEDVRRRKGRRERMGMRRKGLKGKRKGKGRWGCGRVRKGVITYTCLSVTLTDYAGTRMYLALFSSSYRHRSLL